MMIEIQAAFLVLKKWNQNPDATRREIGVWKHWNEETAANNRPLPEVEVATLKTFLRRNASTSYFDLFAE
jgi:hypothetical protein